MESVPTEMIRSSHTRLCLVSCLLLVCICNFALAKEDAKQLYENALQLEKKLKSAPQQKVPLSQWQSVVGAFRSVYYTYPSSAYCDNALFHVGTLYAQMGAELGDPLYFRRACSSYEFLIEQYSSSSLVEESMLEYIRIMRDELKNEEEAISMEKRLKERSPQMAAALSQIPKATAVEPAKLLKVRHYSGNDYSRVVLDFDKEVSFKRNRLANPDRLYFDFENTIAYRSLIQQNLEVDDGFLKQVRVGQNTYSQTRVVLDLANLENYEVFSLYHPFRIIIDIQGKKTGALASSGSSSPTVAPPEMAQANADGQYSLARQLGLKVQRILLDPGHGGHDPGAMFKGLQEKNITLDVTQRLKRILEEEYGFEVLMTRSEDNYVPLEERTAFANSNEVDLFVSIHVNSSRNHRAKGIETYYLNFATTPEAMEVAARENAIAEKNMAELQKLTAAIALNSKIEESREFAGLIQSHLVRYLQKQYSTSDLGVKQAPFYVLIGAQMPSILAEISFLSNEKECSLLGKSSYRQSVAEGLAGGIKNYIDTLAEDQLTQNRKRSNP